MLDGIKRQSKWWAPLFFLLCITPFTPTLDLKISHLFFDGASFSSHPFFLWFFTYGEIPGFILGIAALVVWGVSYGIPSWRRWRAGAVVVILTIVLGAGLCINTLCKGYLGRPRPKQTTEFGRYMSYRPFWRPNLNLQRETQKSFPSGHVAMGCVYFSLVVLGRRYRSRRLLIGGMLILLAFVPALMIARIAQGAHFFSDVVIAVILMWWITLFIDRIVHSLYPSEDLTK